MPLLPTLSRWLQASRRSAAPQRPRVPRHEEPLLTEDEKPLGCGWFDSSHELTHGLHIVEITLPARWLAAA
jgi:hypothetical protein